MFGLMIAFFGIWAFAFILLAPDWLFLLAFAPLGAYGINLIDHTYLPWLIPLLIPILVFDIETLEGDVSLRGIWKYITWLPTVFFLALIGYLFNWHSLHFSFGAIWDFVISVLFIILISKVFISWPIMLFINRLNITYVNDTTYRLKELKRKRSGRSVSYYLVANNLAKLEIPGIVYFYLRFKKVAPNDEIIFKFKTGWLGIPFSRGFPRLGVRSNTY